MCKEAVMVSEIQNNSTNQSMGKICSIQPVSIKMVQLVTLVLYILILCFKFNKIYELDARVAAVDNLQSDRNSTKHVACITYTSV
jgi:hypothetical protein